MILTLFENIILGPVLPLYKIIGFLFSSDEVGCRQVQTGLLHLLKLIPRNVVGGIEGYLQEMKQVSLTCVHVIYCCDSYNENKYS